MRMHMIANEHNRIQPTRFSPSARDGRITLQFLRDTSSRAITRLLALSKRCEMMWAFGKRYKATTICGLGSTFFSYYCILFCPATFSIASIIIICIWQWVGCVVTRMCSICKIEKSRYIKWAYRKGFSRVFCRPFCLPATTFRVASVYDSPTERLKSIENWNALRTVHDVHIFPTRIPLIFVIRI